MTKDEIATRIRSQTDSDWTKKQTIQLLNRFIEIMKQTLKESGEVKINGFGRMVIYDRKARLGRNPKTGAPAKITKGKTIKFKPGQPLKRAVLS